MKLSFLTVCLILGSSLLLASTVVKPRILVYTKNGEGFVHENIAKSIEAFQALGKANGFSVDVSDDPSVFRKENLAQYDALVFSNTNNEVFDTEEQKKAFQEYIRSGGGFVGVHSATGSERSWPWFQKMIGGKFERHAPHQEFTAVVIDHDHPSTKFLPDTWIRSDEAYYFKRMNPGIRVLMVHDLNTVEDARKEEYPGELFGEEFPSVWCSTFEGGRQWYTSYGHDASHYEDPMFRKHLLGGILWVMDKKSK